MLSFEVLCQSCLKARFSSAVLWQVTIAIDNRTAVEVWKNADITVVHVKHLLK